ncbi:tic22-like family protein [Carex rostrata]
MPFPFVSQNPTNQDQNPPPNSLQFNINSFLSSVQSSAHAVLSHICPVGPIPKPPSPAIPPSFARIPSRATRNTSSSSPSSQPAASLPMSTTVGYNEASIASRLDGIPVYALSNGQDEIVLVSAPDSGKSLGLFCFKKEDAEAILKEMREMDKEMRHEGSRVVPVALNKIFQLKADGISFRFIPESSQVVKALKEKAKAGENAGGGFNGVPVFQSRSLFVKSGNKKYRPVFFRKEDLDDSLARVSKEQRRVNPTMRVGDIQVGVFEEILKTMVEGSTSKWDDVVFVPPGFKMPAYQN